MPTFCHSDFFEGAYLFMILTTCFISYFKKNNYNAGPCTVFATKKREILGIVREILGIAPSHVVRRHNDPHRKSHMTAMGPWSQKRGSAKAFKTLFGCALHMYRASSHKSPGARIFEASKEMAPLDR
jgi:hypothetical protein